MVGRSIRACIALAAVVGVGLGAGCADGATQTSAKKSNALPPRVIDFKVTAADLHAEFERDPKAVGAKYQGFVEVSGTIIQVGRYYYSNGIGTDTQELILDNLRGGQGLRIKVNRSDRHSVRFCAGQKIRLSLRTNPGNFNKGMWEFHQGEVIELGPCSSTPVTAKGLGELANKPPNDPSWKNFPQNPDVTGIITSIDRYNDGKHVKSIHLETIDGWTMIGQPNGYDSDPAIIEWAIGATITITGRILIDASKKTVTIDGFELVTK